LQQITATFSYEKIHNKSKNLLYLYIGIYCTALNKIILY